MRFLESAMLYRLLLVAIRPISDGRYLRGLSIVSDDIHRHSTISSPRVPPESPFFVGGARLAPSSRLGSGWLLRLPGLLLDPGGVLRLGVLHPRGLLTPGRVLAGRAA